MEAQCWVPFPPQKEISNVPPEHKKRRCHFEICWDISRIATSLRKLSVL